MESKDGILLERRQYEILTSASIAENRTHVLKSGDTFAVFDMHGDFSPVGNREQGLYFEGTRFVSRMEMWMDSKRPVLLGSAVRDDNTVLSVDLTNPDLLDAEGELIPHGTLHIFRSKVLWGESCLEQLSVRTFGDRPVRFSFSLIVNADFADIFEVRGMHRSHRGMRLEPEVSDSRLRLGYMGLDDVERWTIFEFKPRPSAIGTDEIRFDVEVAPNEVRRFQIGISCRTTGIARDPGRTPTFRVARREVLERTQRRLASSCRVVTSHEQVNAWLKRSLDDMNLLLTDIPHGVYPYAGIPWYNTFFGRDGLLTGLMTLWINPAIARGVLGYLADTQADSIDTARAAEPGKILHECRSGELAALRESAFDRDYGSADARPLALLLAGRCLSRTRALDVIRRICPAIERALDWIGEFGDVDGAGFVEYSPDPQGLTHQGWKDSEDSVFHADGRPAEGPIALCEVQSYVYGAKQEMAAVAFRMNETDRARQLLQEAEALREQFESTFWCDELATYALALDGNKEPCRVRTSNPGHVLFTGMASEERARRIAATMFERDLFSGWGIRTLSTRERRFNPLSYHNGSVWPHDNAVIGDGLARYGHRREVARLLRAFFDASTFDTQRRLPELFCGLRRRRGEGPTPYPVACSPQAWSAVTVFHLLRGCLGLEVDADRRRLTFRDPYLPGLLNEVRIEQLSVGGTHVDLLIRGRYGSVSVNVTRREGPVDVVIAR